MKYRTVCSLRGGEGEGGGREERDKQCCLVAIESFCRHEETKPLCDRSAEFETTAYGNFELVTEKF